MSKIFLGFLISIISFHSEAGRIMRVIPIDTPTGWSLGGPACTIGIMRHVLLVNVGNVSQTVKITTKETVLHFGTCNETGLGSAWGTPDGFNCNKVEIIQSQISPTTIVRTETLTPAGTPGSRKTVPVEINCRVSKSGATNCIAGTLSPTTTNPLQFGNMLGKGVTTQIIEVTEDKGAIIATVFAGATNGCRELKNNTRFNILVNSGRAF